jgi:hypothetical protein
MVIGQEREGELVSRADDHLVQSAEPLAGFQMYFQRKLAVDDLTFIENFVPRYFTDSDAIFRENAG